MSKVRIAGFHFLYISLSINSSLSLYLYSLSDSVAKSPKTPQILVHQKQHITIHIFNNNPIVMSQEKLIKINGARPSPLKINKDSHMIHKPSDHHHQMKLQRNQPLIIYTHSPKIIHTQPRDFMAVVQRLTGMARSNDDDEEENDNDYDNNNNNDNGTTSSQRPRSQPVISNTSSDNNEVSSVLTDEINNGGDRNYSISNPSFADIPLFTPDASSTDLSFFCSPRPGFRFLDRTSSSSPNIFGSSSLSPSFLEFMKRLPEY